MTEKLLERLQNINLKHFSRSLLIVISLLVLSVSLSAQQIDNANDMPTNQWVVKIAPGSSPQAVAESLGMTFVSPVANIPDLYIFEQTDTSTSNSTNTRSITNGVRSAPGVVDAEPNDLKQYTTRSLLDNPLYVNQWHLNNTGQNSGTAGEDANVVPAWTAGYTGDGIVVASVDDGVYGVNPDLTGNFRADLSYSFNKENTDVSGGGHGTSVAGVMAATNNDDCGVGVAYDADIVGIQILSSYLPGSTIATALNYRSDEIDIYNNSWGPYDNGIVWGGASLAELEALANGAATGRDGLGSIYVWAGGNGLAYGDHTGGDSFVNSRFTIAVGASTNFGTQSYYSENGSGIVVNAPSNGGSLGITTTAGSTSGCTSYFGGTSSASPLVAGVVALMLDANPNLTWRDVIAVLIESAEKNDPYNLEWTTNGAGHDIHYGYGFGRVDAGAAVQLASNWENLDTEKHIDSGTIRVNETIPGNGDYVLSSVNIAENIEIESVEVIINATHSRRGDINLELVSPDGTESILLEKRPYDFGDDITDYTFLSMRHWDELSAGTWTLRATDVYSATNVGTLDNWQLKIHGHETNATGSLSINAGSYDEGDAETSNFTFSVTLDNAVPDFTVNYATSNGSAIVGEDYTEASGTLTFNGDAGETKTITVNVIGDSKVESDEQFYLTLHDVSNMNVSLPETVTATIKNDDSAVVTLSNASINEGNSGITSMTFTATVVNAVDGGFTVDYETSNSTAIAGEDYTATINTLTFVGEAGEKETFTINVNGDDLVESNETFTVVLSNASNGNVTANASAIGTIINDDNTFELLTNGSFEGEKMAGVPIGWIGIDTTIAGKDKQKCNTSDKILSYSGDCAFMFKGNPTGEESKLKQKITDTAIFTNGATVTFSAYIDNRSAKVNQAVGKLVISYSNGDKDKLVLRLPDVDEYVLVSDSLTIALNGRSIEQVKAQFQNRLRTGKFFLDDASVTLTTSVAEIRNQDVLPLPEAPSGFRN